MHVHAHIAPDGHEHDSHHSGHFSSIVTEGLQHADHSDGEFNIEIDHQAVVKNVDLGFDFQFLAIALLICALWQMYRRSYCTPLPDDSNKKTSSPPYFQYLQLRAPPLTTL